ncbi:MAG: hypothetical protein PHV34_17650 [Verrucomicrobiae bacterium]|nr:hypothetical protein [Verrucomicrobiae bacterium]
MRLPSLIHLIQAVQAIARCERVVVLGSASLLARFPELGETGQPLELSYDADLLVEPSDEELAKVLHEAVGEGSFFEERNGYHADILRPEIVETLPAGWNGRLVPLVQVEHAQGLDAYDLAILKLQVGRAKDLDLCRHLLATHRISGGILQTRLRATSMEERLVVSTHANLKAVLDAAVNGD